MNAQLVKIDVAAAALGWGADKLFDLVDGGSLLERGFAWVFNLANDAEGGRRDLRFWFPEIQARAKGNDRQYSFYEIEWVIVRILPEKRVNFHAGEVDQMFQIRPRTRIDLHDEICGRLDGGRNFYSRKALAEFLRRRWLGAVYSRVANGGRAQALSPVADVAASTVATRPARGTHKTALRPGVSTSTKSAAHVPASPAPTMQRRKSGNLSAPASLSGADNFNPCPSVSIRG
jgi:hypothetical protein